MLKNIIITFIILSFISCKKEQPTLPSINEIIVYEQIDTTIESSTDSSNTINIELSNFNFSLRYNLHKYYNPQSPEADTNGNVDGGHTWQVYFDNDCDFTKTYCHFSDLTIKEGDVIDSNYYEFSKNVSLDYINSIGPGGSCHLSNNVNFYIGFRLKNENNYNYGWIKFYREDFQLTIVDMAYNIAVDKPIIVG